LKAVSFNNKGKSLYELRKYEDAIQNFDKSIKMNSNVSAVDNNKAAALCHLLKFKEQVQCYSKSIEINPNDLSIHFNKGNCLSFNLNKLFLVIKRLLN